MAERWENTHGGTFDESDIVERLEILVGKALYGRLLLVLEDSMLDKKNEQEERFGVAYILRFVDTLLLQHLS